MPKLCVTRQGPSKFVVHFSVSSILLPPSHYQHHCRRCCSCCHSYCHSHCLLYRPRCCCHCCCCCLCVLLLPCLCLPLPLVLPCLCLPLLLLLPCFALLALVAWVRAALLPKRCSAVTAGLKKKECTLLELPDGCNGCRRGWGWECRGWQSWGWGSGSPGKAF